MNFARNQMTVLGKDVPGEDAVAQITGAESQPEYAGAA